MIPSSATILVVDDVPANIGVLLETLPSAGFEVRVAGNGLAALEQVAYELPDLILLDIHMPGIDGFETCRRLKADPTTQDIPIIFLSAMSETVDKVRGLQLGGADYVTKPIQVEEVLARVNTHLMLKQVKEQLHEKNIELEDLVRERTVELAEANASLKAETERREGDGAVRDSAVMLARLLSTQLLAQPDQSASLHHIFTGMTDELDHIYQILTTARSSHPNVIQAQESITKLTAQLSQLLSGIEQADESKVLESERLAQLSDRERQVLIKVTSGQTNADIAQELTLSEATVRTYRMRIMNKLEVFHLPGLTRFALRHHLIE
ncbi:MAG: response regulator transcription factor [Chloroflexota bacterium]